MSSACPGAAYSMPSTLCARPVPPPWHAGARRAAATCLWLAAAGMAGAQERPATTASRITQVTVAPGIATIERSARISAGARSATFACLPASLDPDSLQISADAGVRVGEFKVTTEDRDVAAGCASPLDDRVRALEDQIAGVQAEIAALRRADRYLDHLAGGGSSDGTPRDGQGSPPAAAATAAPATPAAQIPATAEALRRTSAETLVRLQPLQRRQEALERELKPLRAERDRTAGGPRARVVSVAVNLATDRDAGLRLSYQVRGPGWQPAYRARLDTATGAVVLERLAVVAQRSGEDWNDVRLALTTQAPARATAGPRPGTWTVDVAAPPEPQARLERMPRPLPAPAPTAAVASVDAAEDPMPDFNVTALAGSYATRFEVPQRLSVPASGQRTTLLLGTHDAAARLVTRTVPAQRETAYLVAEIAPPAGAWPAGTVGLYRDGAFVGQGRLDFASAPDAGGPGGRTVPLWFGPDDLVVVQAETPRTTTGTAGFTGATVERRTQLAYRIENRHTTPITLQVIDTAPVSRNAKIEVESRYAPPPLTTAWEGTAGTVAWQQPLAPGAEARFTAEHLVRHGKDVELNEKRR